MDGRVTGIVYRLVQDRPYAFIKTEASAQQVFLHESEATWFFSSLKVGDKLLFEIVTESRGQRAVNVALVEQAPDDLVPGRIVALHDKYGFVLVDGVRHSVFLSASDYDDEFDTLQVGDHVVGRLVEHPGRERPRLVDARREE